MLARVNKKTFFRKTVYIGLLIIIIAGVFLSGIKKTVLAAEYTGVYSGGVITLYTVGKETIKFPFDHKTDKYEYFYEKVGPTEIPKQYIKVGYTNVPTFEGGTNVEGELYAIVSGGGESDDRLITKFIIEEYIPPTTGTSGGNELYTHGYLKIETASAESLKTGGIKSREVHLSSQGPWTETDTTGPFHGKQDGYYFFVNQPKDKIRGDIHLYVHFTAYWYSSGEFAGFEEEGVDAESYSKKLKTSIDRFLKGGYYEEFRGNAYIKEDDWKKAGNDGKTGITQDIIIKSDGKQSFSPLLSDILITVVKTINNAIAGIINAIVGFLKPLLIIGSLQKNPDGSPTAVVKTWGTVRDAANMLLIVGLLLIALANAVRFQIEYYTAKALIPRLVIAAIFINFSLLMTQVILDLGNILTAYFLQGANLDNILPKTVTGGATGILAIGGGIYATYLFAQIILVATLVALITLLAILVLRVVLIWILAIFSPLVFLFSVMPFTRGLTSVWWNYFTKYVFMGTVVALILNVASNLSTSTYSGSNNLTNEFLRVLAIIVLLVAAAMAPIVLGDKLAGAISGKIGDWSRGWKKSAMARSRGGAALIARRKAAETKAFEKGQARRAAGMLGWKQALTRSIEGREARTGRPAGYLGQKFKERYAIGAGTQKLLKDKADQMDFNMAQDKYHRLRNRPRAGNQEMEYQASLYKLVEAGETERLALTREEQAGGLGKTLTRQQMLDRMPQLTDPFMVTTAVEKGTLHLIANRRIQEGVANKLHHSPEAITKVASETIRYCDPTTLNNLFERTESIRAMTYTGDPRRFKILLRRYSDLEPHRQEYLSQLVYSDPNLAEYRTGGTSPATIPPPTTVTPGTPPPPGGQSGQTP